MEERSPGRRREHLADGTFPPAFDAWADSDIRRILASPSSYFCTLDRVPSDISDRCVSHCVGRDSWHSLFREFEIQKQQYQTSPEGGDHTDLDNQDIHSSPEDMDMDTSSPALDKRLDEDGQSLVSVTSPDGQLQKSGHAWHLKENECSDMIHWAHDTQTGASLHAGKVVTVKCGDMTRKIGVDGSVDAIKDAIRSVFGLRTRKTFWVEDEYGIVRNFDCLIPQRVYTLHTV